MVFTKEREEVTHLSEAGIEALTDPLPEMIWLPELCRSRVKVGR